MLGKSPCIDITISYQPFSSGEQFEIDFTIIMSGAHESSYYAGLWWSGGLKYNLIKLNNDKKPLLLTIYSVQL